MKYSFFEENFPFSFDRSINMIPFLPNIEIPKFEKYIGEKCPIIDLKEFSILYQEVSYNEDHLKRIFT